MDRLEELLDKADKTEEEEREMELLLRDYAKLHNIEVSELGYE